MIPMQIVQIRHHCELGNGSLWRAPSERTFHSGGNEPGLNTKEKDEDSDRRRPRSATKWRIKEQVQDCNTIARQCMEEKGPWATMKPLEVHFGENFVD